MTTIRAPEPVITPARMAQMRAKLEDDIPDVAAMAQRVIHSGTAANTTPLACNRLNSAKYPNATVTSGSSTIAISNGNFSFANSKFEVSKPRLITSSKVKGPKSLRKFYCSCGRNFITHMGLLVSSLAHTIRIKLNRVESSRQCGHA